MLQKTNYQSLLDLEIEKIKNLHKRPKLLLHACCAPCSSYVLEYLNEYFDITIFFFNPNISPAEEYTFRSNELKRLVQELPLKNKVNIIVPPYSPAPFEEIAKDKEDMPERSIRCFDCYNLRLSETLNLAEKEGFDYFSTTLSISPHKNADWINEIGVNLSKDTNVKWLFSDFKKKNGYKRSIELSNKYNLYRQNYCGCVYSKTV